MDKQEIHSKPATAFLAGLLLFWLIVVFYVAGASIPFNPLSGTKNAHLKTARILPEGWGFFTRDPLEPSIFVYRKSGNGVDLVNPPGTDPGYCFGLNRFSRRLNFELQMVVKKVPDSLWEKVVNPSNISLTTDQSDTIQNKVKNAILLGDFVFVRQERLPWAWAGMKPTPVMPYKIVNIHIVP